MDNPRKILFTRAEAAEALCICDATLDVMVARGILRAVRHGRRVFIHANEIERLSRTDVGRIWPEKRNGKTVRLEAET